MTCWLKLLIYPVEGTYLYIYSYIYTHVQTYIHTYTYIYTYTYTYTLTHYSHIHIYTHTCIFVCVFLLRKTDLTSQNHDFTGGKSILFVGDVNMRTLAELFLREVCKYQAVIHLDASSTKKVQFVGKKK